MSESRIFAEDTDDADYASVERYMTLGINWVSNLQIRLTSINFVCYYYPQVINCLNRGFITDFADFADFSSALRTTILVQTGAWMWDTGKMNNLKHKDITQKIIGAAFEVHTFLGNGFQEVIYQRALAVEMRKAGLEFAREVKQDISIRIFRSLSGRVERIL